MSNESNNGSSMVQWEQVKDVYGNDRYRPENMIPGPSHGDNVVHAESFEPNTNIICDWRAADTYFLRTEYI